MQSPERWEMQFIDSGCEGNVYKYNDYAIKIFLDQENIRNKINKIRKLKNIKLDQFCLPIDFIVNNNAIIGYYMDYVRPNYTLYSEFETKELTLDDKIKYIKMQEELVKKAHQNNIIMCDLNLFNFILNDGKIYAIDTDNYKVDGLKNDILPDLYAPYYLFNISHNIDENFDKFALTVNFLSYLKKDFYFELLYYYNDSFNYLDDYVRSLDIDKRLKEFLLHQISEDPNKEYLGDHIDLVSSNKRFIK